MGKNQNLSHEPDSIQANEKILPDGLDYLLSSYGGGLEYLPTGVVVTDQAGLPVSYNHKAVELLGAIPAGIKPREWSAKFGLYLWNDNGRHPYEDFALIRALNGKVVEPEEILHVNGNRQNDKWLAISAKPIISSDEKISGAMIFISDITHQKLEELAYQRKQKQIEAAYAFQQQISAISNDPLKILTTVTSFVTENIGDGCTAALLTLPADKLRVVAFDHVKPAARRLLYSSLISQEFQLASNIDSVVHRGEPLLIQNVDPALLSTIKLPNFDKYVHDIGLESLLIVPIKGRNRILGTLTLVRDRGNRQFTMDDRNYMTDIGYRIGLAIDNNYLLNLLRVESTSRRSAEQALEQSEMRFRSIFASTALGIKLMDLKGSIIETNLAFQQMLGYSEDELKGSLLSNYWHPADVQILPQLIDKFRDSKLQSYQLEHRLVSRDNSIIWVSVTFTGVKKNERDVAPAFIVAITENITERKHIEAEIARMKRRLQSHIELERLHLAQELHDGPLQDLYSAIYKIENWKNLEVKDQLENLGELKHDMLNVVQGLRNTAKNLRPPALAEFGLEKAIRSHAEEFQEGHPGINIKLQLAHDGQMLPEEIRLILFRIYQHSLMNILRHADACDVTVIFTFDAEDARLEIQDNGLGFVVPTNWMELVRQGHYGLAGAVERVSLLEGNFSVESKPGEGTIVRVVIPITNNMENNYNLRDEE